MGFTETNLPSVKTVYFKGCIYFNITKNKILKWNMINISPEYSEFRFSVSFDGSETPIKDFKREVKPKNDDE